MDDNRVATTRLRLLSRNRVIFTGNQGIFYTSASIYQRGRKGKAFKYDQSPTHLLCFADFIIDPKDRKKIIHQQKIVDPSKGAAFPNLLSFNYVQLANGDKLASSLETRADKWVYMFKKFLS